MIDLQDTLGDLVTANPARARTLEELDLDYCCEGARTLNEACDTAGRNPSDVVAALESVDAQTTEPRPAWTGFSRDDLLAHIVGTHHTYLRTEAPRLLALGHKVREVHGDRHPELEGVVNALEQLWAELEPHLEEEEQHVFPALQTATGGEMTVEIDLVNLRAEHDSAGQLLDRLRRETSEFQTPADGCASYQAFYSGLAALDADTRLHVHKENNVVFSTVGRQPAPDLAPEYTP
jgi:regulator of cell morphogenesis and NO signaling